jgi:hypothetical protein
MPVQEIAPGRKLGAPALKLGQRSVVKSRQGRVLGQGAATIIMEYSTKSIQWK